MKKLLIRITLCLFTMGVGGISFLEYQSHRTLVLPQPTGPFGVGRRTYDWLDPARKETFATPPNQQRELMVEVWYPADARAENDAAYLPGAWGEESQRQLGAMSGLIHHRLDRIQTHSREDAAVAAAQAIYPVIVFEPGFGNIPTDYTTIAEELASHGYIVISSAPTYSADVVVFHDGRVALASESGSLPDTDPASQPFQDRASVIIKVWAQDVSFLIDQVNRLNSDAQSPFFHKIDTTNLAVAGHSFGGATALYVCSYDRRCKASANLDGTPFGDVQPAQVSTPSLYIAAETPEDPDISHALYTKLPTDTYYVTLKGARHTNFTDLALRLTSLQQIFGILGPIDRARGLAITNAYLLAFFDTYLGGKHNPLLDTTTAQEYPETIVERYTHAP